jgi:pimeloyl-ACP methyl ester carboxylesterase
MRSIEKGVTLCRRGAFAARTGVARCVAALAAAGSAPFARRIVSLWSRGDFTRRDDHILAPFAKSSPEVRRAMSAMWTQPKCFTALEEEIRSLPVSALQTMAHPLPREVSVVVVSASDAKPSRLEARNRLVSQAAVGRHLVAPASGHWIQLDEPELVIDAIRSIAAAA